MRLQRNEEIREALPLLSKNEQQQDQSCNPANEGKDDRHDNGDGLETLVPDPDSKSSERADSPKKEATHHESLRYEPRQSHTEFPKELPFPILR
jgi:hypothetical protein